MFTTLGRTVRAIIAASMPLIVVGCGGGDVSEIASSAKEAVSESASQMSESVSKASEQVKQTATDAAQQVQASVSEAAKPTGQMSITLDKPLESSVCYVDVIQFRSGRPSILQLRSYPDAASETFPSVFVRAELPSGAAENLAGQTVAAQMFVQTASVGPTWFTSAEPVQLKINTADQQGLTAELAGGSLVNAATGASQPISGTFNGVFQ